MSRNLSADPDNHYEATTGSKRTLSVSLKTEKTKSRSSQPTSSSCDDKIEKTRAFSVSLETNKTKSGFNGPLPPSKQPYTATPYGAPPPQSSQHHQQQPPFAAPYGSSSASYDGAPTKRPKESHQSHGGSGYGGSYPPQLGHASLVADPSAFPPGTDLTVVACFQVADQDGNGLIDDKELQCALSSYNQSFSLRTVHLLMNLITNSNARKIDLKEFTELFYSLQNWRGLFERFDRDRNGRIDANELGEALLSLGFSVPPRVLDLLVSIVDKTGGKNKAIEYDNFIECCLTVKGLTEKFKEKDTSYSGSATFSYEAFLLTVFPFLVA